MEQVVSHALDGERALQLARAALAAYDLPSRIQIRPIRLLNNAVFEVSGDGVRLALRIHRVGYRSIDHVRSELHVLEVVADALDGSSVAVPRAMPTVHGDLIARVGEGSEALDCDLLTWINGRVLRHRCGLGVRSAFLLGEGLGRLHEATQHLVESDHFDLPRWDAETMFSEASPFQPGSMEAFLAPPAWDLFQEVTQRTRAVFDQLGREQWGIIHNDFILGNCHFERDRAGWKLGILDFDDLGWGYLLYDLAPLLGNLFDWPDAYIRLRRAFLDGYRSRRPLSDELEQHLPVLMAARHAATLTWLAGKQRRGETDVPIPQQVEIRVAQMRRCLSVG
jgi:Ser/Thr protein kinase RdoA (MazF antagonist)